MLARTWLSLLFSLLPLLATSQHKTIPLDPASLGIFFSLDSIVTSYADKSGYPGFLVVPPSQIVQKLANPLPASEVLNPHYLSFAFHSSRSRLIYLFWGETANVRVCVTDAKGQCLVEIKAQDYTQASTEVFPVRIPADSTCHIEVRIQATSTEPELHGWIIAEGQLDNFFLYYQGTLENILSMFWCMAGMLLMMLLYISSKFIQIRSSEYGYYAAYIGCMLCFVCFRIAVLAEPNLSYKVGSWYFFFNSQLQVLAYCMYFPFLTAFLNTRENNPPLHRLLIVLPIVLVIYIASDGLMIFYEKIEFHNVLWDVIRVILLFTVLYIAFRVLRMKTPYGIFPILGGVSLDFFALVAMIFSINPEWIYALPFPFSSAIFYYFMGISVELLFFSLGLGLKNRRDEVEKVEAQQALRLAAERQKFEQYKTVVEVQESERARIAKDLHDGIGGTLSGIKISLTTLMSSLAMGEKEKLQYERSIDLLNSSVAELRSVAHNMMPGSLQQFGLIAALRDFCDSVNSMKTIEVTVQSLGTEVRQPTSKEIVIYRIIQELINNIVKHAQASNALLQFSFEKSLLSVTVEDDGVGFDPSHVDKMNSSGWKNIRSRMDFLKGTVDIRSAGSGTSIHLQIPLNGIP
jgi:signal transduction histidine kinase